MSPAAPNCACPKRDVLGYGITEARTDPQVYDLRSMLAGQSAADLRDWTTHPLTDLPGALAAGLDPKDPAAQIWLAPGPDPDGSLLGRALYAASRTAALADRPVELVLRTDDGLRHWRFDSTGGLVSTDADTTDAWTDLAARITAHADAARAQADARQRESGLRGPQAESRGALDTAQGDLDTATDEHSDAGAALGVAETGLTDAQAELASGRARRDHWESEARKLSAALLALPDRIAEVRQRESAASGEVRNADAFLEHIARTSRPAPYPRRGPPKRGSAPGRPVTGSPSSSGNWRACAPIRCAYRASSRPPRTTPGQRPTGCPASNRRWRTRRRRCPGHRTAWTRPPRP